MDLSVAAHIASNMLLPQQSISPPESLQTSEAPTDGWDNHSSSSISPPLDAAGSSGQAPIDWKMILGPQATQHVPAPQQRTPSVIPPAPDVIGPKISSTEIEHDAKFFSYAAFETVFEQWKQDELHPFRVASSETLKMPDGTVNDVFRYRYVVYNCAHYGNPRKRGEGKRPKQNYLPCGCKAMLRLNYNFNEQALKISTLVTEHTGHDTTPDGFDKLNNSSKMRASGTPHTRVVTNRRPKELTTESVRPALSLLKVSNPDSDFAAMVAKAQKVAAQSNITVKAAMLQEQRQKLADLLTQQAARAQVFQQNTLLQAALGSAMDHQIHLPTTTPSPPVQTYGVFSGSMQQLPYLNQPPNKLWLAVKTICYCFVEPI